MCQPSKKVCSNSPKEDYLRCKKNGQSRKTCSLNVYLTLKFHKQLFNKLHVFKGLVANKSTIICFLSLQGIGNKTTSSFLYSWKFQSEFFNSETFKARGRFLFRPSFVLKAWPQLDQYLWCRSQCVLLKAALHKFHAPNDWKWDIVGNLRQSSRLALSQVWQNPLSFSVGYSIWTLLVASVSPPPAAWTVKVVCMKVRMATHFIVSIEWQKNKKLIDNCWDLY